MHTLESPSARLSMSEPALAHCAKHAQGFSLPELVISMAVMSVLVALAVPQMEPAVAENRLRAVAGEWVDAASAARSEAAKRGVPVVLCPRSSSGNSCNPGAANWNAGWLAFADTDGNGVKNGNEPLLFTRSSLPAGYEVGVSQGAAFTVLPSGELIFAAGAARTLKVARGQRRAYVVVNRVGRATVLNETQCTPSARCEK